MSSTKTIFSKEHQYIIAQLKKARFEAHLTQKEVASLLNKTQSYVSKMESGQRRLDIIQIKNIAKLYKKTLDYFITQK